MLKVGELNLYFDCMSLNTCVLLKFGADDISEIESATCLRTHEHLGLEFLKPLAKYTTPPLPSLHLALPSLNSLPICSYRKIA